MGSCQLVVLISAIHHHRFILILMCCFYITKPIKVHALFLSFICAQYELENARLRDANHSLSEALATVGRGSPPPAASVLEDEAVLESIESSFNKFHSFLDLLRDAGWVI